jgi:hypothetical protein
MSVQGCSAVLPALLLVLSQAASAADGLNGAAREVARKAALWVGTREAVSLSFRNSSSLPAGEVARARRACEAALREAGVRTVDTPGTLGLRIAISGNPSQYLLVGEGVRGEERQVWIASWPRGGASAAASTGVRIERRLVWEQGEPILDAATPEGALLVLSPSRLTLYARENGDWKPLKSTALSGARVASRDPRGRLRVGGPAVRVFLSGMTCSGSWRPSLQVQCTSDDEPWDLESGNRPVLFANFAAGRNYFDGRIATPAGVRKTVPPFFSAAAVTEAGASYWVLAGVDGRAQIYDSDFTAVGTVANWGSDIAGTAVRCGAAEPVLATRPGESGEAVQAWTVADRQAGPAGPPLSMPGPVTALWPDGDAALAVVRDGTTGNYAAYRLTLACGQ